MLERLTEVLPRLGQYLLLVAIVVAALLALRALLAKEGSPIAQRSLTQRLTMLAATVVGLVVLVVALPDSDQYRMELLTLLGVLVGAVFTLSSTTFASNLMGGFLLRAVDNFRVGDFLRVGDSFGRVTERGLFHVEIQTDQRDLVTLPNMLLVTQPTKVVRRSGTIVTAQLSLGYDEPHARVEKLLREAASKCGLEEPFVRILELGDHSVTYRAAGFLKDVERLLGVQSQLRAQVLDTLHGAGVEIVSPIFLNERRLLREEPVVPAPSSQSIRKAPPDSADEIMFDKAKRAAELEGLVKERDQMHDRIAELRAARGASDDAGRPKIDAEIAAGEARVAEIDAELAAAADETDPDDD